MFKNDDLYLLANTKLKVCASSIFVPTILKNVDFPDILVPVNTIPFPFKIIELGTGFLING